MLDVDTSLLPREHCVLVAVSGGADSMALLVWLRENGYNLVVGHVNHALNELRDGDCARDEEWLRDRCSNLDVSFKSRTIQLERRDGHVNESTARIGRYNALELLARESGCSLVATAHTASDALEGLVLNLGRGAGVRGQNAFSPSRTLGDEISLVRPFWRLGRDEVRNWLGSRHQSWLEDRSNTSDLFRRNRVRNELMPLLSDVFNREVDGLAKSYAHNAALARDEDSFLERMAKVALDSLVLKKEDKLLSLDGTLFAALDVAIARRVVRLAAQQISPELRVIERVKIEAVRLAVLNGQKREVWVWRSGVHVEWTGDRSGKRLRFWRV